MKPRLQLSTSLRAHPWGLHPAALEALVAAARGDRTEAAEHLEQLRPAAARTRAGETVSTGGVAVLSLRGMITPQASFLSMLFGGGGLQEFRAQLHEAAGADDITGIVIDFDTPGGSTDLVAETAADIRAARAAKPIVAVANTWAASAGYWLASQADELVVTPSGEVGSIGVFLAHEEFSAMDERLGIKTTLVSAGKYKTEGNPYEPLSDEARAALQAKVDAYYDLFVADVALGRQVPEATVRNGFGEGRMLTATDAVAAGMADRVDTLEGTIAGLVGSPQPARRSALAAAVQRAAALAAKTSSPQDPEGDPEPNAADPAAEEATARPSESYIDVMFDSTR